MAAELARVDRMAPQLGERAGKHPALVLAQHRGDFGLAAGHQHDESRVFGQREADGVVCRGVAGMQGGDDIDPLGQLVGADRIFDGEVEERHAGEAQPRGQCLGLFDQLGAGFDTVQVRSSRLLLEEQVVEDEAQIRLAGAVIDEPDVSVIGAEFLQQGFDELVEVVDLLELAAAVLVHPAVAGEDVQLFQQFGRLAGLDFVHCGSVVGMETAPIMRFVVNTDMPMQTEHFIAGKDASLESSIATMQGKLAELGFHVEERSWLNPVAGIWSVHVRDRDCPLLFSNGKGGSRLAALASALGEFFERLSCNYFWTHYYLGPRFANGTFAHYPRERWFQPGQDGAWPPQLLTPELHLLYNPDGAIDAEALVDLNSGNAGRGICALPYLRQRDGAEVWFPVNIIGNLYVSNGMSAGNTQAEARTQALAEIFERHVKFRIISEGLCLPDVPEQVIARYPRIAADIRDLRAAGFGILVKDASLGGEYPVMNVTLLHPQDQGCFASFGAHPRFEIALERALTELLQGRGLDALGGFPEPGFDLDEIASPPNLEIHFVDSSGIISWNFLGDTPDFEFSDWNFSATTDDDYHWLVERIHRAGHDIYIADFSHLGVYACRILVPGMSEIYPLDDLQWDNNSVGNIVREAILRLPELDDDECADLLAALSGLDLPDSRPVAELIGLAADADSFWSDLRVGELKTLLALAIGDDEGIGEGCEWVHHFQQLDAGRRRIYRCIDTLLDLGGADGHRSALHHLYGEATVATAEAMLDGQQRFFGITALGEDLKGSEMHQRLLAAYDKLRR
jgi:ribosomal protein S12 methylthiotransferase accessory factor